MVFGDIFVRQNVQKQFSNVLQNTSGNDTFTFSTSIVTGFPHAVYKDYTNNNVYLLDRSSVVYKFTTPSQWAATGGTYVRKTTVSTPRPESATINWHRDRFYQGLDASGSNGPQVSRSDISNGDVTSGRDNNKKWNLIGGFASLTDSPSGLDYFRDPADGEDKLFVLDVSGLLQIVNVDGSPTNNYEQQVNIKTDVSGWSPVGDITSCKALFGGKKLLVASRNDNTIWEMDFGIPYDLSTLTYSGSKLNLGSSIISALSGIWVYWRDPYKSGIWACGANTSGNKVLHIALSGEKYITPVP